MDAAIEMRNVTKQYPLFTLDDLSLTLERGTIMGLIGENGAGKTTTLKLLMGIIRADAGKIALLGETDAQGLQRAKARVGVVLDEGFFSSAFTAVEIERVCRGIYPNWDRAAYGGWLKRFDLPERKKYKELSKGMKTKLALAVALSHGAELLVLDEATGGLDPVVRAEVLDLMLDFIQDERRAILFSTHITTDLERIADSITFLHKGRVALEGDKDTILARYGMLKCGAQAFDALDKDDIVGWRKGAYGFDVLIKDRDGYRRAHPDAVIDPATLDDIMLYTIKGEAQ